jgi:hypothetical protein
MRDAKQLTDFIVKNKAGNSFDILGTYLTPNGQVYLKLKNLEKKVFVNYPIANFTAFLIKNGLEVALEPIDQFENKNFVSQINQGLEL